MEELAKQTAQNQSLEAELSQAVSMMSKSTYGASGMASMSQRSIL